MLDIDQIISRKPHFFAELNGQFGHAFAVSWRALVSYIQSCLQCIKRGLVGDKEALQHLGKSLGLILEFAGLLVDTFF